MAWDGICGRHEDLNLDAQQKKLAETLRERADHAAGLRVIEAYRYLLVPQQRDPRGRVELEAVRIDADRAERGTGSGSVRGDGLGGHMAPAVSVAESAGRRLLNDGTLAVQFPAVILRQQLDGVLESRWTDGHVPVSVLWEDMARYVYLPRLRDQDVLLATVATGPEGIMWRAEGFGVAVSYDDASDRYVGLSTPGQSAAAISPSTLVVRADILEAQYERDLRQAEADAESDSDAADADTTGSFAGGDTGDDAGAGAPSDTSSDPDNAAQRGLRVFRGSVKLDASRPTQAFTRLSDGVLTRVLGHPDATVDIRVEIEVRNPAGFDSDVIRNVNENTRELDFEEGTGFTPD